MKRAHTIIVAEDGAQTKRGVGIGDDLALVRGRYEHATCRDIHTEGGSYPFCAVRVGARRYLWFGQHPIASVTLSRLPLGGSDLYVAGDDNA